MQDEELTYRGQHLRVLVLVPDSKDSRSIPPVLKRVGVDAVMCSTLEQVCSEIDKGTGALLLDEKALSRPTNHCLTSILDNQPSWSELPIIILLRHGPESGVARSSLLLPADVTLVELPVRVNTLVAVVRSALRSRLRQYMVRDQMQERERLVADLERSNRELQQFAHVASHDLQEPLRMVSSYLQLLEKKYRGRLDETADTYIHYAVDGARRMQALIEGLLNYSRIARPQFTWVDLNRIFADATANLATAIVASDAVVKSQPLPTAWGDATQMLQLFQNLISNGIKYRKPGVPPRVEVSAIQNQEGWVFSVRDNGIGMKKEDHEKIFQMFQRLHTKEEYPGTGIGLASCKKIVEQHQGRIWVESSPGEGTTISFTIPNI
ncbi:ATP-binding protein [Geotalea sp. SG265]|uniref:sensor histidine kinase n=1 Tax=Geotalea sp. SG265 TaxID=2922867 RepID=UPI001FAF389F|nr:ATP-binding protein [Geotalea sp. SG265]